MHHESSISDELVELYAEYGIAAEAAQVLEVEAGNLAIAYIAFWMGIGNIDDDARQFYRALVEDVNRKTLGALLSSIKKSINIDQHILDAIDDALDKRNYLTHHFFRNHNFGIHSEFGRTKMIEELKDIRQCFSVALVYLSGMSTLLLERTGIPSKRLEEWAESLAAEGQKVSI